MARSMESSATFYSQIVGAAAHYEIARRTIPIESQRLSSVRLRAKSKTMERLRQEIYRYNRSPSAVPFDCLLMAIFALAVHDNIDLSSPDHDHGLSQLAKIRDMHIYGRVVFGEEHMSAMYQLVEQRGGLDKVDESAFGKVIPL